MKNILKIIILITSLTSYSQAVLNDVEKEFIKNNPILTIQNESDWKPYNYSESGTPMGHSIEYMKLLASKVGFEIQFVSGYSWKEYLQMIKTNKLDIIVNIAKTPKREAYLSFTSPYSNILSSLYMIEGNNKYETLHDLKGKTISVVAGMVGESVLKKNYPEINIYPAKTSLDALKAVIYGKADGVVQANIVGSKLIKKYNLFSLKPVFEITDPSFNMHLHMATKKSDKVLISILEKAKLLITEEEQLRLKNKYFNSLATSSVLSLEDKKYLDKKKRLLFCVSPNWYPFEKIEKGKHIGMGADFLALFQKNIDIPFTLVPTSSWKESLTHLKNKKCDFIPLVMKTPKREAYLSFTKAYLEAPLVIATKKDIPFIQSLESLDGQKIGILKSDAYSSILKKKYQNFELFEVNSLEDGLNMVVKGELFGYIDALASISYQFQENYFNGLKITGKFDDRWQLSVAVKNEDTELLNIFNKLVEIIKVDEKQKIINKYVNVKYEHAVDYSILYKVIVIFIVIILLVLLWNKRIKDEKKKVEVLNRKLKENEVKLKEMNEELEQLSSIDKLTNILNRRKIDEALIKELERSKRTAKEFSLVMLDIDKFKSINDVYGHQVGDDVLTSISSLLSKNIRGIDILGRWGGEEFLIICPYTSNQGTIENCERLRQLIETYNFDKVGHKTASFGVTTYIDGDNLNTILKRVDTALYKAKNNGRNRVVAEI